MVWNLFRPDIGYVQGMTYIAFMFLIRMDKIKTFKCFANLLFKSNLLLSLYSFQHNEVQLRLTFPDRGLLSELQLLPHREAA